MNRRVFIGQAVLITGAAIFTELIASYGKKDNVYLLICAIGQGFITLAAAYGQSPAKSNELPTGAQIVAAMQTDPGTRTMVLNHLAREKGPQQNAQ
jgi:hypothetical protein